MGFSARRERVTLEKNSSKIDRSEKGIKKTTFKLAANHLFFKPSYNISFWQLMILLRGVAFSFVSSIVDLPAFIHLYVNKYI